MMSNDNLSKAKAPCPFLGSGDFVYLYFLDANATATRLSLDDSISLNAIIVGYPGIAHCAYHGFAVRSDIARMIMYFLAVLVPLPRLVQ